MATEKFVYLTVQEAVKFHLLITVPEIVEMVLAVKSDKWNVAEIENRLRPHLRKQ